MVTVEAGSSPVYVGTLTRDVLYTSLASALEKVCPKATKAKDKTVSETDTVTIKGIDYKDESDILN